MGANGAGPAVAVDVLGPLRLIVAGEPVPVRGPKRRAVLALLALAEGRAVTVDHLLGALWAADPPESGRAALHSHVSRLRGHLGSAAPRLETLDGGYRLRLDDGGLDAARARLLLTRARTSTQADPGAAAALLREARALWRGPVLADLVDVAPIARSTVDLEQLHRDVTALLIRCSVQSGQLDGMASLAAEQVAADPLAEPAVLLLIRALAATGRPADALRSAREYRRRLAEETGLDPSPALDQLERAVARGELEAVADPVPTGTPDPPAAFSSSAAALARPVTPLVGRDGQVAALHRLLASQRLVTVVGPGGVGKTSLAREVARREGAAAMLLLAPVTDPTAVPDALAAALDLRVVRGDVLAACVAVLGTTGSRLLLIDNCEHLLDAVRDTVAALLDGCPELIVLTTSREPLGLAGECPLRLTPLAVPGPRSGALDRSPAVAVFLDRARRVRPAFRPDPRELDLVAKIVRRLDGMPLAIELAAGRLTTFSLAELADRLDRSLDLLGGGRRTAELRHHTLRATVEWSYQLLPEDERRLFCHLSVFVDGVDLATAEEVAAGLGLSVDAGSALAHLVDASMINAVFDGGTRYRMLEILRAFGLDRLAAAGETSLAEAALLRWAVALASWIDAVITTEREPGADAALRRELPNLRAAWRLARHREDFENAATLVVCLHEATQWRDLTETWGWAEELVDDPGLDAHPRFAEVLGAAAEVAYLRGDYPRADRRARDGLARAMTPVGSWMCLSALAEADLSRGAFTDVVEHSVAASALARRPSLNLGVAALAATYAGDLDQASALNARLAAVAESPTLRGFASYVAGEIDNVGRRWDRAEEHYRTAIALARTSGATFLVGIASVGLDTALAAAGRVHDALRGYRDVIDYWSAAGNWTHQWVTLRNLADLLRRLGDLEPAALLDAAADRAPDAPSAGGHNSDHPGEAIGRAFALEVARQALARHLAG